MDFVDENSDQRRIFKVFAICSPFILRHRFGNKKCINNPSMKLMLKKEDQIDTFI